MTHVARTVVAAALVMALVAATLWLATGQSTVDPRMLPSVMVMEEAVEEAAELQAPLDAMLARQLYGDGTIYAGTDDGNLWFTHDGAETWTKATDADLPDRWITRVEVDPRDDQTAYVTYSGFRNGDDTPYVFRTTDGGVNWTDITGDLPSAPVNDINVIGDWLVVAGDVGVYASDDGGQRWYALGTQLPNAPVHELRWHAPSAGLYAATFGRGLYRIDVQGLLVNAAPVS